MNKLLMVCGLFIFSANLHAQVQKGAILTGGGVSFNGNTIEEDFSIRNGLVRDEYKRTFLAVRPQIGFLISESTLLGVGVTYEYQSTESRSTFNGTVSSFPYIESINSIFLNPYLTKFNKLADKLYFTTTINLLAGVGSGKYGENNTVETNILEFRINATPGVTYFISEKWAARASIGNLYYNLKQQKLTADTTGSEDLKNLESNYGVSVSFNTFGIGFQYYLNNKSNTD